MNAKKSSQHGDRIVAPQSAMTPNYLLRNSHDPERHATVSGIPKLPPLPYFPSRSRAEFIGVIVAIATEAIFVAIVMLARVKAIVWVVFFDIGFERPVFIGLQTRRRRGLPEGDNVIVDQVLIVAGRAVIEFAFRHLLPVAAWDRDSIPVRAKIDYIKESRTDWKVLPSCFIVFGLENDQKRTVFIHCAALFNPRRP